MSGVKQLLAKHEKFITSLEIVFAAERRRERCAAIWDRVARVDNRFAVVGELERLQIEIHGVDHARVAQRIRQVAVTLGFD